MTRTSAGHDEEGLGQNNLGPKRCIISKRAAKASWSPRPSRKVGDAGLRQHVGKRLVDDALARELPRAEPRRLGARDRLDQIAARGAEPAAEPEREAVRGEPPGLLDVAAAGDQGVRRPDRDGAARERIAQLGFGGAHGEACRKPATAQAS